MGPEDEKLEVVEGESVLLPCEASGIPQPVIQWRQNFAPFTPSPPWVRVQPTGLYFQQARLSDKAIYECVVSNVAGIANKVITLIVYSKAGFCLKFCESLSLNLRHILSEQQFHCDPVLAMSVHNMCLYLFCVWAGVSVVEVSMTVRCMGAWLLMILFTSVYHLCKVLWVNYWKNDI